MSPLVFVLSIASWLASIPVQSHPGEWKSPLPIPSTPQAASSSYDRVLVKAPLNAELQVKNRQDFETRIKLSIKSLSVDKGAPMSSSSSTGWMSGTSSPAHLAYCGSFVRSVYANCGIWIPASTIPAIQPYGRTLQSGESYEVGDILYVRRENASNPSHIGIFSGDGVWKHPGSPDLPTDLARLNGKGYQVAFAKRLVSVWR